MTVFFGRFMDETACSMFRDLMDDGPRARPCVSIVRRPGHAEFNSRISDMAYFGDLLVLLYNLVLYFSLFLRVFEGQVPLNNA